MLLSLQLPLPSLGDQQTLMASIDRISDGVERSSGLLRDSVEARDALLRSVLERSFGEVRDEQVWPLEQVCSAIVDNLHSNPSYAEAGVPCIRSPDVLWGRIDTDSARRTSESEYEQRTVRGAPTTGDVVVVREGGRTGLAAVVEAGQKFSLGQRVMLLRPDVSRIIPRFLLYQFLSPLIQERHIQPQITGSASPHLNISSLRQFPLWVPAIVEQQRVVEFIDRFLRHVNEIGTMQSKARSELDTFAASVLDSAFRTAA
jgi:type I restriction enzyme S subunit